MSVQCCVLTFAARSGTGTQTITGVVDADGDPFVGELFLFQSGYAAINTVTAGGIPTNAYMDSTGIAVGAIGSGGRGGSQVTADADAGFRDVAGAFGGGYCLLDFTAQPSFGGIIQRRAYISAVASGSFTLTYDQNDRTGDDILVTVIAGVQVDDLTLSNSLQVTTAIPRALLVPPNPGLSGSLSASNATGGTTFSWGWDVRDDDRGASALAVELLGSGIGQQLSDRVTIRLNPDGTAVDSTPVVSAWDDLSLTVSGNTPTFISAPAFALGGETVRAASGVLTQPVATGEQAFTTGIDAKWIMFVSQGAVSSSDPHFPTSATSLGWGDSSLSQVGFWSGETGFNVVNGARYLSDSTVLRFGTANSLSTTFNSLAELASLESDGTASLNWTLVDGTAREILWFALGEGIAPAPTPSFTTRTLIRRRVRRAPVVWSEKGGFPVRITVNNFYLDLQPGVGNSEAPDPQVMIRASKDGGRTWGNERMMSAGRVGEYFRRVNAWRWGSGRAWVFEVSVSDSAVWNLINCYADMEPGDS